ncbi:MAG: glycosyltransferase family 2 protein [Candidatus Omnitrophota bacterium]
MSVSVIIPAFNEEKNITPVADSVLAALEGKFSEYEIIIFDDCSTDKTAEIIDQIAARNLHVKVVHNEVNKGFGYNYRKGVELARYDYVGMIPGDGEISASSIKNMYSLVGKADIIIPYTVNRQIRPLARRVISRAFTETLNILFGLRLKYYNGPVIHRRELIQSVGLTTDSFAFQAQALVKLLKAGHSFVETGMFLVERKYGKTNAFRWKNIVGVLKTVYALWWDIYFPKK